MKGLLLKELFMIRKTWISITIFIATFGCMGIFGGEPNMMLMISIFISIWSISFLSFDDVSKWRQYSLTLPYGRKTIVSSKYLAVLLSDIISAVLVLCCYMISVCLKIIDFSADELVLLMFLSVVGGVIYPVLTLPLYYRFSSEKARMFIMVAGGIVGGTSTFFMKLPFMNMDIIINNAEIAMFIILASVVIFFILSWLLSVKIYEKRDL